MSLRITATAIAALLLPACNGGNPIDASTSTVLSGLDCHDGLIEAAHDIAARYPDVRAAKRDGSLSGFDYREAHLNKELEGAGYTLVTITGIANVRDWTGNLNEPSLLFFEKTNAPSRDWQLIGFGYHMEWDDDDAMGGCVRPTAICQNPDEFEAQFLIHEAGYHVNGFRVARQQDIRSGRGTLDAGGCTLIDKNDVKSTWNVKHGRAWTMHVWLSPETNHPFATAADPWNRDGGDGWQFPIPDNTFFAQTDCGCGTLQPETLTKVASGIGTSFRLLDTELNVMAVRDADSHLGLRTYPELVGKTSTGIRITALTWFSLLDDLGLRTDDIIERIVTMGSTINDVAVIDVTSFDTALAHVRALTPGSFFFLQVERDGVRTFLTFFVD
jgi:hypothetical protein